MLTLSKKGDGLDRLVVKLGNLDQFGAALDGVNQFNKKPDFYPIYARNFISKSVKNNADGDPRLGYIKQVSFSFDLGDITIDWPGTYVSCSLTTLNLGMQVDFFASSHFGWNVRSYRKGCPKRGHHPCEEGTKSDHKILGRKWGAKR